MNLINKIISNAYIISVLKKFNVILFGVFSTVLLNRYLGVEKKGEYAYIFSIVNILIVIFNMGITLAYPNFKRRNEKKYLPIFFSLSVIEFIILIFLSVFLGFLINNSVVLVIFLLTAFSVFRLQLNYYNLVENIKIHSIITILATIINFIMLLIVFFVVNVNIYYTYLIYMLKDIVIIIGSLFSLKIKLRKLYIDFSIWKKILRYGLIPMYTTLLISINYKIDVIILKGLNINLISIGLYTVGVSLAEYAWLIPDIFKDVMINKTAKKDNIKDMTFSLRISSTMMILIFLVIVIIGKPIIQILYGTDYVGAYPITVIIFLGIYSMIYCKIIGTLYIARGEWKFYSIVLTLSVISNILMNSILIPNYGIYGAAFSSVFSYSIAGIAFLHNFKTQYKLHTLELLFLKKKDIKKIISVFARI